MPAVFTGMLQGEELSQAYASGGIFVMPSESPTLGLVVLETKSSGLPVVVTRVGGIPDMIPEEQQGKTGYLFNPGDFEKLLGKQHVSKWRSMTGGQTHRRYVMNNIMMQFGSCERREPVLTAIPVVV
ncbi:Hypothetical predicted protein [Olea europaea subsp. europaea]|uniref:Glycosyl transferase family 1 domain-containing protein n=1 Tax=Olea europaea subsp. europaea TaxID=158383 RepID=A0A8S0T7Z6_OLEEU|nr:Hypothetical predicted protein [Olea europaea subsp. europaea]